MISDYFNFCLDAWETSFLTSFYKTIENTLFLQTNILKKGIIYMEGQLSGNCPRKCPSFVRTNYSGVSLFEKFCSGNLNVKTYKGKSESRTTRIDSEGNHVTVVICKLGDQSHTVTTKVDFNVVEERTENFININGTDDLINFNKRWETGNTVKNNKTKEPNRKVTPKGMILVSLLVSLGFAYYDSWF